MWTNSLHPDDRAGRLFCILLGAVLLVSVSGSGLPQELDDPEITWFLSNRDFMRLDELAVFDSVPPDSGWTLLVERRRDDARHSLYLEGVFQGREELSYLPSGALTSRDRYDAAGELQFAETLRYRSDGTLRAILRCDDPEDCIEIEFDGIAGGEHLRGSEVDIRYHYDERGRIVAEYEREGDAEPIERRFVYVDDLLDTVETTQGAAETIEQRDGGRIVSRVERQNGRLVSEETYDYDTSGRLTAHVIRGRRDLVVNTFTYGDGEDFTRESTLNGVLIEREVIDADGQTIRERFSEGSLAVREVRDGGELLRRETWLEGRLLSVERLENAQ